MLPPYKIYSKLWYPKNLTGDLAGGYQAFSALFLLSFDKATSLLTNRSKQQIIVHGNNVAIVINQINQMYLEGYRVTSIVGQSISTSINGYYAYGEPSHRTEYGEIIVIMEK